MGDSAEDTLTQLSSLIEQITQKQGSIALHAQNIKLASSAGLEDEANAARELMTMFLAAPEDVWLPFLAHKEKELGDTMDGVKEVHELYQRAEQDYLSVPILSKHMDFIIEHQDMFALAAGDDDADETTTTRTALEAIVNKGASHLTQGHELWNKWRDWELQILESDNTPEHVQRIDKMFMARLQTPHSAHEETAQAYSTFTSTFRASDDYEKLMVAATKARAGAVKAWNARETSEIALKNAGYSLDAYAAYLKEEHKRLAQTSKPQPPRKGRKAPARNPQDELTARALCRALHERAVAAAVAGLFADAPAPGVQEHLRSFWASYAAIKDTDLATLYRATRSVPGSGDAWARYLRALERHAGAEGPKELVEDAFARALEGGVVQESVEELVPLVQARADYERRQVEVDAAEGEEGGPLDRLVTTLEGGIELVRKASKDGDSRLRLERYLAAIYEQMDDTDKVLEVWEGAAKFHKTSYLAWSEYLRVLVKADAEKARAVFRDVSTKNLDWPEMLWDAWLQFEHVHGSVDDVEDCIARIRGLGERLAARRAKEAEAYQSQYAAAAVVQDVQGQQTQDAMQVDETAPQPEAPSGSRKRKAEDEASEAPSAGEPIKRVKIDESTLKRDRENSTVIVADLEDSTDEAALKKLFKDCGEIREIKVIPLPSGTVATVEFMSRDSIPAALTRDKKRIGRHEVSVHVGWKCTLYVTNFPEDTDDAAMRKLFGEFGALLEVRWPSKKFKSSRRFCYVQYTSPAAAEKALSLHRRELAPGMLLSVLVSDPTRKKERTDADSKECEVYIAGLSRFTKREDLQSLFQQFGPIKDVRMALDDKGHSKGFAFVEFAESRSAHSALTANNYELKSRRIAVTLADPRVRAKHKHDATGLGRKASVKSRSVRVRGLPPATQEGLLQQALEKEAEGVKRVEVFMDSCEAVVELETQQAVGALLLRTTPIVFQDHELVIVEESAVTPAAKKAAAAAATPAQPAASTSAAPAPTSFLPRGVASRPRAGIGSKKRIGQTAISAGAGVVSKATTDTPMDTGASTSTSFGAANGEQKAGKGQDDFRKMLGL